MNDKAADAVPQRSAPKQDVFETTDLEVGRAFMNTAYGTRLRMRGTEGNQLLRHARYDLGSFSLDDAILSMETSYRADPLANSLAVVEPRTGWVEHESAGLMEHTGVGDLSIISPPDLPFNAHTQNLHYGAVVLDVPLLMQVAGSAEDGACARPRFTSLRPTSPAAAGLWRSTVGYVRDVLASSPEVFSEPLVLGSTARLLAAAALTTFPNTAIGEPTSKDRNDATSATVHRALVFIEENAHTDIGISEVAAAVCVSPRALRYAFRLHHGISLNGSLRRVRLERAHFDLLAADPTTGVTVSSIAARWGFARPGNFSAHYHDLFGVSPGETLSV